MRPTHLDLVVLDLVRAFSVPNSIFSLPVFQCVSHLSLCDVVEDATPVWNHWAGLSRLPALIHLAIIHGDLVPTMLATLPRLQVLILYGEKPDIEGVHSWDRRVVVIGADLRSFWKDWHEGVDPWIRADSSVPQSKAEGAARFQLPTC
ncbi:hypothetical protein C8R45DRAFT_1013147 [Mycena sanguinolenta]|nr:hypothetical protein C8R45DRAFT_1013147 [Mycena sanguinolenta]